MKLKLLISLLIQGVTYNIYVVGNKKTLDFSSYQIGTTKESNLIFTNTTDLSAQEAISSNKLTPTVTGYYLGATMTYGKNYLGYDKDDITSGNNFIDGAFYVHRLISRVFLSSVTNNNTDLKITAVSILNAKSKSKLFPSTPPKTILLPRPQICIIKLLSRKWPRQPVLIQLELLRTMKDISGIIPVLPRDLGQYCRRYSFPPSL